MRHNVFTIVCMVICSLVCSCRTMEGPEARPLQKVTDAPKPMSRAALDEAFTALATHEFGKSRTALVAIEREVALSRPGSTRHRDLEERLLRVLGKAESPFVSRRFACRQLSLAGGRDSVPVLAALLGDVDLGEMARYALERIPGKDADKVFLDAASRLSGVAQIGAINSMGRRRQADAVAALVELGVRASGDLIAAALAALGRIGSTDAALALATHRDLASPVWTDAWLECANRLADSGDLTRAAEMFDELFGEGVPSHVRSAALDGLVRTRRKGIVPVVVSLLADPDPATRLVAADYVRDMPGKETTATFVAELANLAPEGKTVLIGALGARGDVIACAPVTDLVAHGDSTVRVAAVRALGRLGNSASVGVLSQFLATGADAQLADVARESLVRLRAAGVDGALVGLLTHEDDGVVSASASILAGRGASRAVPELHLVCAGERSTAVRKAAVAALAQLAGPRDVRRLVGLIVDSDDATLRTALQDTLVAACRKGKPNSNAVRDVLRVYRRADGAVRVTFLQVLGRLGGEDSLRAVTSAFYSDDEGLRDAAIRVLGAWPDASADDVLAHIAETTPNEIHRVLALRGLVRTLGLASDRPDGERLQLIRRGMSAAKRSEDRKLVLSALGQIPCLEALALCGEWIEDDGLGEESGVAAVAIADAVKATHRAECEALLERFLARSVPEAARIRLASALETLRKYDDYLRYWQFSGPYTKGKNTPDALFAHVFPPEDPGKANTVSWTTRIPADSVYESWFVDFGKLLGGSNCVAYARTWVWVPSARKARLELGSDDGVKVWLNGVLVHSKDANRALQAGEDIVEVDLVLGWNRLLAKVRQGGGDWAVAARLRSVDGTAMAELGEFGSAAGLEACRTALLGSDAALRPGIFDVLAEYPDVSGALDVLVSGANGTASTAVVTAAIGLAGRVNNRDRKRCGELLRRLQVEVANEEDRGRVATALDEMSKLDDYIMLWEVAGPFSQAGVDADGLFEVEFGPEPRDRKKRIRWQFLDTRERGGRAWEADLAKGLGDSTTCVGYLKTRIWVRDEMAVRLEMGSDDAVKAWLNGELVHANNVARPVRAGDDQADVLLRKGWNELLLKVVQRGGNWGACARFRTLDNCSVPGLRAEVGRCTQEFGQ